jgi:hypothetical protein
MNSGHKIFLESLGIYVVEETWEPNHFGRGPLKITYKMEMNGTELLNKHYERIQAAESTRCVRVEKFNK